MYVVRDSREGPAMLSLRTTVSLWCGYLPTTASRPVFSRSLFCKGRLTWCIITTRPADILYSLCGVNRPPDRSEF